MDERRSNARLEKKRRINAAKSFFTVLSAGTHVRFKSNGQEWDGLISAVSPDAVQMTAGPDHGAGLAFYGELPFNYQDIEPGSWEVVKP